MNLEEQLKELKAAIEPVMKGASIGKIKYVNSIFDKIITIQNRQEAEIDNAEGKLNGFFDRKDYLTTMHKYIDILILLGASDTHIKMFRYDILRWICENNESQTRPFTFVELINTHRMVSIFDGIENKMPESLTQLKEYFTSNENI